MRRRGLLRGFAGAALAPSLAGCLPWGGRGGNSFVVEPVASLAGHVATNASSFAPAQLTAVDDAIDGGEHVTYGHRPFSNGTYLEVGGTFYRVSVAETGTERLERWVLGADRLEDAGEDAVPLDAYPEADRDPIAIAYRLALAQAQAADPARAPDPAVYVFRTVDADETALLPTPRHEVVDMPDGPVRLWTDRREIEEAEYTTTVATVASDAERFERSVEDVFVVDLDGQSLSPEERAIVETTIETGEYRETGRISGELSALLGRLDSKRAQTGVSLFQYEGRYYSWEYRHTD